MNGIFYQYKMNLKLLVCAGFVCRPRTWPKKAAQFQHVEPPFWWIGMKTTSLQILFYNKDVNVSEYTASLDYPGVALKEVKKVSNPHYLFLTLEVSPMLRRVVVPIAVCAWKKEIYVPIRIKG